MNETKRERLFEGITGIRDDLIEEAAAIPAKRHPWRRWAAAAACVCLVLAGALAVRWSQIGHDDPAIQVDEVTPDTDALIISTYIGAGSTASSYKAPEPGEFYCELDLAAALEAYAGQDVRFFVGVDVFSAEEYLRAGNAELETELERLRGLGLDVGYAQAWEYQGTEAEHVTYIYAAGCLTAETLQNFPVNPEYGYAFRFIHNGDGSAPTAEQQNIVTDYPCNVIA